MYKQLYEKKSKILLLITCRPKDRNISRRFDQNPAEKATRSIDRNLQHRKIDGTLNIL
jgi:hypothetical protein